MAAVTNLLKLAGTPGEATPTGTAEGAELFAALVADAQTAPATATIDSEPGEAPAKQGAEAAAAAPDAAVLLPLLDAQRAAVPVTTPAGGGDAPAPAVPVTLEASRPRASAPAPSIGAPAEPDPNVTPAATGNPLPATAARDPLARAPAAPDRLATVKAAAAAHQPAAGQIAPAAPAAVSAPGPAGARLPDKVQRSGATRAAHVGTVEQAVQPAAEAATAPAPGRTAPRPTVGVPASAQPNAEAGAAAPSGTVSAARTSPAAATPFKGARTATPPVLEQQGSAQPAPPAPVIPIAPVRGERAAITAASHQAKPAGLVPPVEDQPAPVAGAGEPRRAVRTQGHAPALAAGDLPVREPIETGSPAPAAAADRLAASGALASVVTPAQAAAPAPAAPAPTVLADQVLDLSRGSEWIDELAHDIARTTGSDGALRFRLNPGTLGELRVEITQTESGAHVRLEVTSEAAQQALAEAQPKLAAEARAQGVRIAETEVNLAGGQGEPRGRQQDQAPAPNLRAMRTAAGTAGSDDSGPAGRRAHDRYA